MRVLFFCLLLLMPGLMLYGQAALMTHSGYNAPYKALAQAYAAFDPSQLANAYAENAVYVTEQGPLNGQQAIQNHLGGFLQQTGKAGGKMVLEFALLHRSVTGGVVTDVGYYRLRHTLPDGRGVTGYGKFVTQSAETNGVRRFILDTDRGPVTEADFAAAELLAIN